MYILLKLKGNIWSCEHVGSIGLYDKCTRWQKYFKVNQHVDKYKKSGKSVSRVVWACV